MRAFLTAAVAGGYLLYASSVDRVVREQVAVAAPGGNVAVARGAFGSAGHETTGAATLLRLAVPATVDTERHRTVVIWCRAFSVAFGSARLA